MRLLLSAIGSYGNVLPMAGIGAAARARGHRVQVIANPYFRPVIEEAGLELLPLGTVREYEDFSKHPDLWHPHRGVAVALAYMLGCIRQVYALIDANYQPGETVLAAHSLDLAGRAFHDKHRAPMATVLFAPFAFPTVYDTPKYVGTINLPHMPRWMKEAQYRLLSRFIDPIVAPVINRLRSELALEPLSGLRDWTLSPQLVLAMFPDWFGAPQPDWPAQTALVGFPLWDSHPAAALPEDVEEFLSAGEPPIVFAPGSANQEAKEFFAAAVEVCLRLERRGMLMTKYPHQIPVQLPRTVRHFSFAPFGVLLPRAAALVHHGGVGTSAQGLAAGLPQLVMPIAFDQLDNGVRLTRLGVAAVVRPRRFRPTVVARALAELFDSPTVPQHCRRLARQCDGAASCAAAAGLLEQLLPA